MSLIVIDEARRGGASTRDAADEAVRRLGVSRRRAYRLALGRLPSQDEARRFMNFLGQAQNKDDALTGFCRVLLNTNEFVYID